MFRTKSVFWLVAAAVFASLGAEDTRADDLPAPIAQPNVAAESTVPSIDGAAELEHDPSVISDPRFFPAVFSKRRFGPVEEPEQEFYALRDENAPGFEWNPPSYGWGFGPGWGGVGWGYRGFGWGGYGWGFPRFSFGFVGYNRYAYRPWYASPSRNVWSNRYPWYTPGGAGPNIYQPWYYTRATLPWYSPYGVGPNIYTPTYTWRNYYPWFSPNGVGPNIYTPPQELGGCLYW